MTPGSPWLSRLPAPPLRRWWLRSLILTVVALSPYLFTYNQPVPPLGFTLAGLSPCPQSPNCVCADFAFVIADNASRLFQQQLPARPSHFVPPIELQNDSEEEWKKLEAVVRRRPGVRVVKATERYLRAERRTTIYGLIDDVELVRLHTGTVLVRSAARLGYADFGRNRRFVESLRAEFEGA